MNSSPSSVRQVDASGKAQIADGVVATHAQFLSVPGLVGNWPSH